MRPKATLNLPDKWEDAILDIYREGGSDVEVKAWLFEKRGSFSNDLWDRWLKEEPKFSETIKIGKLLSEAWWTKNGRECLKNPRFNYTGWYMNMKNRFGWRDKQEVQHSITEGQHFKIGDTVIQF
jgi:hypothetical protein